MIYRSTALIFLVSDDKLISKLSILMDALGLWQNQGCGPVGLRNRGVEE